MTDTARWIIVALLVACVIGIVGYARGHPHHHGDDVGAFSAIAVAQHFDSR